MMTKAFFTSAVVLLIIGIGFSDSALSMSLFRRSAGSCVVTFYSPEMVKQVGYREQPCNNPNGKGKCQIADIDWSVCICGETKDGEYIPSFPVKSAPSELSKWHHDSGATDYACECLSSDTEALARYETENKNNIFNPCMY